MDDQKYTLSGDQLSLRQAQGITDRSRRVPLISIVIPTWNSARTLAGCLDSVFGQTFKDFEVMVVDDGSTDDTRAVLQPYEDRIRLIIQENRGSNPARNRGWHEAKGEYLLFLDSDITLRSGSLEILLQTLNHHPEASYAYASFLWDKKLFRLWPFDEDKLRQLPYIHTAALVRAKDFPGFDEQIKRLQDWDVWLTMLEQGKKGIWVPEVLFTVAPRVDGISQWAPKWFYWIPWRLIGWKPARVKKYEAAMEVIRKKHGL